MHKNLHLILLLIALVIPNYSKAQESLFYEITNNAKQAFGADNFAELDERSLLLRKERRRLATGNWQLSTLHSGILSDTRSDILKLSTLKEKDARLSITEEKLKLWIRNHPKSAIAPILLSDLYVDRAFLFRGTGMANTVTSDGWRNFKYNVQVARQTLEKYKSVSAVDPYWYARVITIARLQGDWPPESVAAILEEGSNKEPLFHDTYLAYATYLSPLWGGNIKALEEFADSIVKRTQSTEGNAMYARIFWGVYDGGLTKDLFVPNTIWPKMRAGFEDLEKRYPSAWNRNGFAKFACLRGDVKTVQTFLGDLAVSSELRLGDQLQTLLWPNNLLEQCRSWAAAFPSK
jgi:hypothetical protein